MEIILYNPLFGIALTIGVFYLCKQFSIRFTFPLFNPLLLTILIIIFLLSILNIPLDAYREGANTINMFLAPATTVLAYSIYRQITLLKKNLLPILCGCLAGSITSMVSSYVLCRLFGLEDRITFSVVPKSVTTPIAMEISEQIGGVPSVTIAVVVITGILGSVLCPIIIKLLHLNNSVANGVAIGTCSHAVGTSKALELGSVEGAMSGIAIGVAGIITVILALFF